MKASLPAVAVLCSVMCFAGSGAGAQPVYRCGNTYSQSPCPAAVAVDVDDLRAAQHRDSGNQRDEAPAGNEHIPIIAQTVRSTDGGPNLLPTLGRQGILE